MKTEIACIIDRSGSMGPFVGDTVGGFNSFLREQQAVGGEANLTLVLFNEEVKTLYSGDISKVPPLTPSNYVPQGITALLDAIGATVDTLGNKLRAMPEDQRPDKVIVAILTDGYENASKEYTSAAIHEKIKHQQDKYAWDFIFLAANQDAFTTGASLGIRQDYTRNYLPTGAGVMDSYAYMSTVSSAIRSTSTNGNNDSATDNS